MTARTLEVSVIALPDTGVATMFGVLDVLNSFGVMGIGDPAAPAPFRARIVGAEAGPLMGVSGIPVPVSEAVAEIDRTDIVIVPSIVLGPDGWKNGRYPGLLGWASRMHEQGGLL